MNGWGDWCHFAHFYYGVFDPVHALIIIMMESCDQIAKDGPWQTAQVSPLASLMYPYSPQIGPQLFLIVHAVSLEPTKKTAWLMFLAQLEKTPLL